MMDIDLNLALTSAKKIAVDAGNHLLKYKDTLNEQFFSTDKDIKLKADLMAEKRIL